MKKIIAIALALVMCMGLMAACGAAGTGATESAKPKLVMATNAQFPPYEFYEEDAIIGIDAEIAGAIADKLGMELPTTEEEFYNCLVAFRDNAETLLGGDASKMVPYSTSYDIGWRNDLLFMAYVPDDAKDEDLYINGFDDRHLLYPNYKEGVRVLNKWYNEGLVWKDFAEYAQDSSHEDDMMKAGFVGAFQHNWDYPYRGGDDSIQANIQRSAGDDAAYIAVDCFVNDAGVHRKFLAPPIDRKVFFPATNDEPLASLLYLDVML